MDFPSSIALSNTLRELVAEGQTLLWVTHHPAEIPPKVTRAILWKGGRVFADGSTWQTLTGKILSELYEPPLRVRHARG